MAVDHPDADAVDEDHHGENGEPDQHFEHG